MTGSTEKVNRDFFRNFTFNTGPETDKLVKYGELNPIEPNSWNGTTSDWATASNWDLGFIAGIYEVITIDTTGDDPIINTTTRATAYSLTITGATLTINSGGSLIVTNSFTGDITYNRAVTGSASKAQAWHLVSSPFTNETIEDLRTNNAFATSNNVANRIGIADYNNTDEDWDYLLDNATGSLVNGQGYSTRLAAAGNITFIGSVGVADVPVSVTKNTNGLNLLGYPFASYINSKTFLDDANNTTEITNKQIWIWDSSANARAGDFIVKPSAEEFQIARGQGFFVEAAVAGSVTFAKTNQSHQTDTFEKSNKKTEITLRLKDSTSDKFTKISFHDNSTIGFDNGYEGELFNGVSTGFNVFTQLIENNSINYQIQSLPMVYEDLIIPIDVKSTGNKEITFSTENTNLPENLNVFIEDRAKNIFINLNENNYKVTLNEVLDGVGRFFLHTSSKAALNIDDNLVLDNISIYKANSTTLRIVGLQQGNANIKLYNVVGKQIMNTDFEANGAKQISLPYLTRGVYIVQLETEIGILNKKNNFRINQPKIHKTILSIMKTNIENTKHTAQEEISRKDAIKKIGNYGKYAALTALGTYMILNPQKAQASSAPADPGTGF